MRASLTKYLFAGLIVFFFITTPAAYSETSETPESAFQKFRAALLDPKTSTEDLNSLRPKNEKAKSENDLAKDAEGYKVMRVLVSTDWKVIKVSTDGDKAELSLLPKASSAPSDSKMSGKALMILEDGQWKFKSIWLNMVTENVPNKPTQFAQNNLQKAYAAAQTPFTQKPVEGTFNGRPFRPTEFSWDGANVMMIEHGAKGSNRLILSFEKTMNTIGMKPGETRKTEGPSLPINLRQGATTDGPRARLELADANDAFFKEKEYGVHLSLGTPNANGLVPGYIVLATPDGRTSVSGYFYAKFDKSFL